MSMRRSRQATSGMRRLSERDMGIRGGRGFLLVHRATVCRTGPLSGYTGAGRLALHSNYIIMNKK